MVNRYLLRVKSSKGALVIRTLPNPDQSRTGLGIDVGVSMGEAVGSADRVARAWVVSNGVGAGTWPPQATKIKGKTITDSGRTV